MVDRGSGQGSSVFATAGIVGLFRGLQKSENAALGHEMPFPDGHEPTGAKLSEAWTFADATKRCTVRSLYHIALVIATDAANIIFRLTHNSEDDLATSLPGVEI
jgi:hypothetical protein